MSNINQAIDMIYQTLDGPGVAWEYGGRHRIETMNVLTITSELQAREEVAKFAPSIAGKSVIEIGGGVGYLALEMARHAERVTAIEVDPAWSWCFTKFLYATKPPNLAWIFGGAECVVDYLRADVAVIVARSGLVRLVELAEIMAPQIVLVAGDSPLIAPRGDKEIHFAAEWVDRTGREMAAEISGALGEI